MSKFVLSLLLCLSSVSVLAWQPSGPIRVIVGQSPGGGNELAMRAVESIIEKQQGASFVIQHYPGMDNVVAMNYFADQKPDGQTILVTALETSFVSSLIVHRPHIRVNPHNYIPVAMLGQAPLAFIVPANSAIKTVPDLINHLSNKNLKKFNVGLSGATNLLAYNFFVTQLKLDSKTIQPVNYNSPATASLDVANGNLDMAIVTLPSTRPLHNTKIRILAQTGNVSVASIPDVPMIKNHVPGLVLHASWSVFLPPKTPDHIVAWFAHSFQTALDTAQARAFFFANWANMDSRATNPKGLSRAIREVEQAWYKPAESILRPTNQ